MSYKEVNEVSEAIKKQRQQPPGSEEAMEPKPLVIRDNYKGSDKLKDKVALITGGDSGIGRSIAVHFAREGADIALVYLSEDEDAKDTVEMVEKEGRKCLTIRGDLRDSDFCSRVIDSVINEYGKLNILINHVGEQHPTSDFESLDFDLMRKTYETNIFSFYYITKPALRFMKENDSIINTSSVTAYRGSEHFLDYAATNGAIVSFTRSLAKNLAERKIRVNAVAPGPIWTPLIPSTFDEERVKSFGKDTPMGRAGQPCEVATSYVFLASEDGSYMTGQVLHPNGGSTMAS